MLSELVSASRLKNNTGQVPGLPKNPRLIKDEKFDKLKKSIQDDPEMLELREVIAYEFNGELVVIAGNMRLKACTELGIKQIPTKILPPTTPIEKLKAYTIKDNVPFGENDWQAIQADWPEAEEWGLDIPGVMIEPAFDELTEDDRNKPPVMKITFKSPEQLQAAENDIQELIDRKYTGAFYSVSAGEI